MRARIAWLDTRRAQRGWLYLLVAFLLAIVMLFDTSSFIGPAGLGLPEADWVVWSADVPATWSRMQQSGVGERVVTDAPEVRHQISLAVRRASGVRWTPERWRFWFGRSAVAMGLGDEVALSTRARMFVRVLLAGARVVGMSDPQSGNVVVNGFHLGVFGNSLVVATSSELLAKLRSSSGWTEYQEPGISFIQNRRARFGGTIDVEDDLALSLWIDGVPRDVAARDRYFAIDWPTPPMISVQSRGPSLEFESEVVEEWWSSFPAHTDIDAAWRSFEALLPEGWRTGTDSVQFALFGVDTTETIPIPDAAVYARSETPLAPLVPPLHAIPYEWSGTAGWMTPWKGEGAHLFVVANDRARVFTNEETTMAALMSRERAGRIASNDAVIDIDAARVATALIELARDAAKNELWPEKNADDVEREILPWIRAFGALGDIHLAGNYENGPLVLRGGTQAPVESAER